jgi:molecular chaperone GrpE
LHEEELKKNQPVDSDEGRDGQAGKAQADPAADEAGRGARETVAPANDDVEETRRERDQFRALAQRVQADFVNYRKRVDAERDDFRRQANRDLLLKLLPVLDGLDLALQGEVTKDVDQKWVEGVRAVRRSLDSVLAPEGVEAYGRAGEQFDPRLHEAIARVPTANASPDTVLKVHRAGYRLHGEVIRPAMVEIAAAPSDDIGGV